MHQLDKDERHQYIEVSLFDSYAPHIFPYLYRRLPNRQDAEDVLLEVFLVVCKNNNLGGITFIKVTSQGNMLTTLDSAHGTVRSRAPYRRRDII